MSTSSTALCLSAVLLLSSLSSGVVSFYSHPRGYGMYRDPWNPFEFQGIRHEPPPCPAYSPIEVQRWAEEPDGYFVTNISMPGVAPSNRRFSFDDKRRSLTVRAARALPLRGRACLPRDAWVSRDGRFEVLERSIDVPPDGDLARISIRDIDIGVELRMPKRWHPSTFPRTIASQLDSAQHRMQPQLQGQEQKMGSVNEQKTRLPQASVATSQFDPIAAQRAKNVAYQKAQLARRARLVLPTGDGIEIVNEEWRMLPKLPDAAEGYFDNRGEFHFY